MAFNAEKYLQLTEKTYFKQLGKVVKIVGLTIESVGPDAKINDLLPHRDRPVERNLYDGRSCRIP